MLNNRINTNVIHSDCGKWIQLVQEFSLNSAEVLYTKQCAIKVHRIGHNCNYFYLINTFQTFLQNTKYLEHVPDWRKYEITCHCFPLALPELPVLWGINREGPFPPGTYSVGLISELLTDVIPGLVAIWIKKRAMPTHTFCWSINFEARV